MTLTPHRNHLIAARFFALANEARSIALDNCIDWIEQGITIPEYTRIDAAAARYYAEQSRICMMRAIQSRYMRTM